MIRTEFRDVAGELNQRPWMRLVVNYSHQELSFGRDKLVGISGLAQYLDTPSNLHKHSTRYIEKPSNGEPSYNSRVVSGTSHVDRASKLDNAVGNSSLFDTPVPEAFRGPHALTSTYLAGIFTPGLPRQLLREINHYENLGKASFKDKSCHHYSPYFAPTWSWASMDWPIEYCLAVYGHERSFVKVYTAGSYCMPAFGESPTGPLTAAQVLVEGSLAPVILMTVSDPYYDKEDQRVTIPNSRIRSKNRPLNIVADSQTGRRLDIQCDILRERELNRREPGYNCWTHGCCCRHDEGRRSRGVCQGYCLLKAPSRESRAERNPSCTFELDRVPGSGA